MLKNDGCAHQIESLVMAHPSATELVEALLKKFPGPAFPNSNIKAALLSANCKQHGKLSKGHNVGTWSELQQRVIFRCGKFSGATT